MIRIYFILLIFLSGCQPDSNFNIINYGAISGDTLCDAGAIQKAINHAYSKVHLYGNKVIIPSGIWYINKPDTLKSFIQIEISRNAKFIFPDNYSDCMWIATDLEGCYLSGGNYYCKTNTYTFLGLYPKSYIMMNCFNNLRIENANTVIDINGKSDTWINANSFENIIGWIPITFLNINAENGYRGIDGNLFSNIQLAADVQTRYGIKMNYGTGNQFFNWFFWDFYLIGQKEIVYIGSDCRLNIFNGITGISTENITDLGIANIFN